MNIRGTKFQRKPTETSSVSRWSTSSDLGHNSGNLPENSVALKDLNLAM